MNCEPVLTTKESEGWTMEDGRVVEPHTLYRYLCSCGNPKHAGLVFHADRERALASYHRRAGDRARLNL